jgi:hypothetical protein
MILFENKSLDLALTNGDLGFHDPNKFGWEPFGASNFQWTHFQMEAP